MKILFMTSRIPYPPQAGGRLRAYYLLKHLSRKHDIHLISFVESPLQDASKTELSKLASRIDLVPLSKTASYARCALSLFGKKPLQVAYYSTGKMRRLVQDVLQACHFDAVICHLIRMDQYIRNVNIPKILEMTDSLSLHYSRAAHYKRGLSWLINHIEEKRIRTHESGVTSDFDATIVVSKADNEHLESLGANGRIEIVPNGVDAGSFTPGTGEREPHSIVFVGNMPYPPNRDAAVFLAKDVMPLVWQDIPDARLYLVGANPPRSVRRLSAHPFVDVTGFVDDVRDYYRRGALFVALMRFGAGIQNKVLEAMACGCPVLTSPIGAHAIVGADERSIAVAPPAPDDAASAIVSLLKNPDKCRELAANARRLVEQNYAWDKVLGTLDDIIDEVVRRPKNS